LSTGVDDNLARMKRRKKGINLSTIIIYLVILFLVAKFLGLTKDYLNIDHFEFEPEILCEAMATAIGVGAALRIPRLERRGDTERDQTSRTRICHLT